MKERAIPKSGIKATSWPRNPLSNTEGQYFYEAKVANSHDIYAVIIVTQKCTLVNALLHRKKQQIS